jgi:pilus assembly protein CpaB
MQSKVIRVVIAVLLATTGTGVLVRYVESARSDALADEQMVNVLIVQARVDRGTPAAQIGDKVRSVEVPARVRPDGAVTSLDQLGTKRAAVDLLPGEQLVKERFNSTGNSASTPATDGLLQVTVALDAERTLGGNVRIGDTVGVLLSVDGADAGNGQKAPKSTHLVLHKVPVTNVQVAEQTTEADKAIGKPPAAIKGNYLVTLAVSAPAAEQVVFTAENGTIWLAAEPVDAPTDGTKTVNGGNLYTADAR